MTTFQRRSRRLTLAGGFAFAIVAVPAIAVLSAPAPTVPAPVAQCMPGQVPDPATGACPAGPNTIPGDPNMPAVGGIPCTGANTGECIGLQESEGGAAIPAVP
jgi:hypothetical protein